MLAPDLATEYRQIRQQTLRLTEQLSAEDMVAQSMPDASPTKWHLAHTTWFFETFLLCSRHAAYRLFDERFNYLFNSYYESAGARHPRAERGLLTRHNLTAVIAYRDYVDAEVLRFIDTHLQEGSLDDAQRETIITGLHHEMQHQELMLTDILHLLSRNPLLPAVVAATRDHGDPVASSEPAMLLFDGGLRDVGAEISGFSYDCERPRHTVMLPPYRLADRLVTNAEWLQFMADGGYANPSLWLLDGWQHCQVEDWQAPLYWRQVDGEWHQFGLDGLQLLDLAAPVCHISYYEADAYARWAGKRLPTEQEWECVAESVPVVGNFLESAQWRSRPLKRSEQKVGQLYGEVWEWTQSSYQAYPGFRPSGGALQEYNGKFMANQFVLRGGSCVTPRRQLRATYRNYFHPHQRWQFTGLRLARDA